MALRELRYVLVAGGTAIILGGLAHALVSELVLPGGTQHAVRLALSRAQSDVPLVRQVTGMAGASLRMCPGMRPHLRIVGDGRHSKPDGRREAREVVVCVCGASGFPRAHVTTRIERVRLAGCALC